MKIIILDGVNMPTVEAAHRYLARALGLPDYYGGNLDALADCLSGFGSGVWVIVVNAAALRRQLGGYTERLLDVFRELSAHPAAFRFAVSGE